MDDTLFYQLAAQLNKLTAQYQLPRGTSGALMHHQYADMYDKTLDQYGLTKKQFVEEVKKRSNPQNAENSEVNLVEPPAPSKKKPIKNPVYIQ